MANLVNVVSKVSQVMAERVITKYPISMIMIMLRMAMCHVVRSVASGCWVLPLA